MKSRFYNWNPDLIAETLVWRINVQNGFPAEKMASFQLVENIYGYWPVLKLQNISIEKAWALYALPK